MSALLSRCPACEGVRDIVFVESWRDPIAGVSYQLRHCGTCDLVFSEPRDPVGPDWYEKAAPLRAKEGRSRAGKDWRFLKFFGAGLRAGRLLDIGCGDGGFLGLAQERGWEAVGVDYESRMIALARSRGLDACARDFTEFLKSRSAKEFDAVTLFDVLEHVPEPRFLLALIKPVLKRGGHLVVTFPNNSRPILFRREEHDYPPHHFTRWTVRALRDFLEREGFVVETTETVGPSVRWFSEILFDGMIAPTALALARRLLFGAAARGPITTLYSESDDMAGAKSLLADKSKRQALADFAKLVCRVVTYPAGAVLALICHLRKDSGEHLYALARYEA